LGNKHRNGCSFHERLLETDGKFNTYDFHKIKIDGDLQKGFSSLPPRIMLPPVGSEMGTSKTNALD
jgi:hypothetical protein